MEYRILENPVFRGILSFSADRLNCEEKMTEKLH